MTVLRKAAEAEFGSYRLCKAIAQTFRKCKSAVADCTFRFCGIVSSGFSGSKKVLTIPITRTSGGADNDKKINEPAQKGKRRLKKMDKLEKEEFDALNGFMNEHAQDYLKSRANGIRRTKFEEHIVDRLRKKGYIDFSPKAKNLKYDCGLITNKGYDYYCELRGLERKLRKSKWDYITKVVTVVNIVVLIIIAGKALGWW